jgi:4-alpha-glucanotransferase
LLHVTSLPSAYGIGDVGPGAFAWVDRLGAAGQSWWQALPLGPTGYGDSPYQCLSSFAGNGLLASPDSLIEDGLLHTSDCESPEVAAARIDYRAVIAFKHRLLDRIWDSFRAKPNAELRLGFEQFCHEHASWLDDYALFRALKEAHHNRPYVDWPAELVRREPAALAQARRTLRIRMDQVRFAQFLLFRQGARLKAHAQSRGVGLIGDLPFFVSPDSSDVWANPELFLLDDRHRPRFVAGVPPDAFSAEGQLWGNPVYDWAQLARTGYRWWIDRLRALLAHVDVIRLDHFRAFAAAWHVPPGAVTAQSGHWEPGPGAALFSAVREKLGCLPFVAEDLGLITPDVSALRDQFQVPGTRVLQFAFGGSSDNPHLPHNYSPNTVVYTGTHDNATTRGWFELLPENQRKEVKGYLNCHGTPSSEITRELIRLAWSSNAALAMVPMQDLLNLGPEARMNTPGTTDGNWTWRCTEEMLSNFSWDSLRELTTKSGRRTPMSSSAELRSIKPSKQGGAGDSTSEP